MQYQIQVTDADGLSQVVAVMDNLPEAQDRFEFIKEAFSTPDMLINSPSWQSIDLYRVEGVLGAQLDPEAEI
jgi:hypothetical protein